MSQQHDGSFVQRGRGPDEEGLTSSGGARLASDRVRPVLAIAAAVGVLLLVVALQIRPSTEQPQNPAPDTPAVAPRLQARGQVRPSAQAKVGTLVGGTLSRLAVEVGDSVVERQEIARVRGADGTEVLVAPMSGTVTSVLAHVGDTVMPGTIIATVGDLSRLQVETTDVDEFLVGHVEKGQPVTVLVEALDRREVQGRVRAVAIEPQISSAGDEHYPVVIDLLEPPPGLRVGMTVRVSFSR